MHLCGMHRNPSAAELTYESYECMLNKSWYNIWNTRTQTARMWGDFLRKDPRKDNANTSTTTEQARAQSMSFVKSRHDGNCSFDVCFALLQPVLIRTKRSSLLHFCERDTFAYLILRHASWVVIIAKSSSHLESNPAA